MGEKLNKLLKMESGWDVKNEVATLTDNQKSELLNEVVPVCQQWLASGIMPNGDIGLLARYQEIRTLVENSITTHTKVTKREE